MKKQRARWETVFDANRDNKGKGIPIDDFIALLKRINKSESVRLRNEGTYR